MTRKHAVCHRQINGLPDFVTHGAMNIPDGGESPGCGSSVERSQQFLFIFQSQMRRPAHASSFFSENGVASSTKKYHPDGADRGRMQADNLADLVGITTLAA